MNSTQIIWNFFCSLQIWWTLIMRKTDQYEIKRSFLSAALKFVINKILKLTSRPTQKEWSCVPHCLAAFVPAKWRAVIEATNDESRPPERRTPKGTSVISLLITAWTYKIVQRKSAKITKIPACFLNFANKNLKPSRTRRIRVSHIFKSMSEHKWIIWGRWNGLREPKRIIPLL